MATSPNPERSRMQRLRSKTVALVDEAVEWGHVTSCDYDPDSRSGSTYYETSDDEEITVGSDGHVHISSFLYGDVDPPATAWLSVTIPDTGPVEVMEVYEPDDVEAPPQSVRSIPPEDHDDVANFLLHYMFTDKSAAA